jgi:uncharacterized protein
MIENAAMATLERERGRIETLCRKYGVQRMRVFGSCIRGDWNEATSDFDFLVEFGPPPPGINLFRQLFGLTVELEALLRRKVDIVDWKASKKPHFRAVVEAEAEEWYAA